MPLPHSCGIMLLWKQHETIEGLSCGIMRLWLRHHANFTCGIAADSICRLIGFESRSRWTTCGIITILIDLYSGIIATSTLLWYYTAQGAVWDQTCLGCGIIANLIFIIVASLSFPHFCGIMLLLVAVWDQTWPRLRHLADLDRRLVGQLAASLPTWFVVW
jgi:hypothetical protein